MSAIELQGVSKRFGKVEAVCGLDLGVPKGSLCGFIGPNGAGKSTTIRMVMAILPPDSGSVRVLGGGPKGARSRVGYLPESRGVYPRMRVGAYLEYVARLKGAPITGLGQRVRSWLARLGLEQTLRLRCRALSKGMQQKVQLLAALVHEPELVILDEPFSGLDPVNAELVEALIAELRDGGTTFLLSTHVLAQAERLCDRIVMLHEGRKLLDGSPSEIRRAHSPPVLEVEPEGVIEFGRLEGVERVEGEGLLRLHLDGTQEARSVMQAVLAQGPVRSLRQREASLQEVFVKVVGGRARVG